MAKQLPGGKLVDDRQARRLEAAKKYMRGEISRDDFLKIERQYESPSFTPKSAPSKNGNVQV